jgi:hypothetical protein
MLTANTLYATVYYVRRVAMSFIDDFQERERGLAINEGADRQEEQEIDIKYGSAWEVLDKSQEALIASAAAGRSDLASNTARTPSGYEALEVHSPQINYEAARLILRLRGRYVRAIAHTSGKPYESQVAWLQARDLNGRYQDLGFIKRSTGGFRDFGVYVRGEAGKNERVDPDSKDAKALYELINYVSARI